MDFDLPKAMDDVAEPEPLPEDWYELRIIEEPEVAPNRAMQDRGPADQDARMNIVLSCEVVNAPDESFNGRPFRIYLSMPNSNDAERRTKLGQTYEDLFISRIKAHHEAFGGGEATGSKANFEKGQSAMFYIIQELGQDGITIRNNVDINSKPRPIDKEEPF